MPNLNKASLYQTKARQHLGELAETKALDYLQTQGFTLLHRNFRCKMGEIDLIGVYQNQLIFIEVRLRKNDAYGGAIDSVDFRKQQKLKRTAQFFLVFNPKFEHFTCRFDVVAVTLQQGQLSLEWIQDAFY